MNVAKVLKSYNVRYTAQPITFGLIILTERFRVRWKDNEILYQMETKKKNRLNMAQRPKKRLNIAQRLNLTFNCAHPDAA